MKAAIIGAGWAGLAAAIDLTHAGADCHLFEAAAHPGGRARSLAPSADGLRLDNGQHILIGAYHESLRLMRAVGLSPERILHRRPLQLQYPDGSGLQLPDLAPPWDALLGIARARGWSWRDKAALLHTASRWRLHGFRCPAGTSVSELCAGLPQRLMQGFITPLCVSALNTPTDAACGQVFLRVLRDSLFSGRGGSHLLIPRTDLGACFAQAACAWLQARGSTVRYGLRVPPPKPLQGRWVVQDELFDGVIIATDCSAATRLLPGLASSAWLEQAAALRFNPITTVYAQSERPPSAGALLPAPMLALQPQAGQPAQFVFDRGQLGGPAGLLAFVVSDSCGSRADIEAQVLLQAGAQLGLHQLQLRQTVVEKRATFACTPGLQRPAMALAPGLWAAGDYIAGPYPATLEGAVRSGCAAAQAALSAFPGTTG